MSARARGKTTTASRDTRIPSVDIDFNESGDEVEAASSSSRKGRPTLNVDDDDDDELEVVPVAVRPTKRRRVPTIKEIIYRPRAVDAAPRAGAADISTRLERIEAAQTKLTTLVTSNNASTEQLGKRVQKLEKSNGDVMERLERVEALLEKVLERLG